MRGNVLQPKHRDFFSDFEISYEDFAQICNKGESFIITFLLIYLK